MVHEVVTKVSMEAFVQKAAGKKIVLLYPWTNYRALFLGHFFSGADSGLLYYRIADGQTNLRAWLAGMAEEFSSALESFGRQLQDALANASSAAALGEALGADMAAYRSEHIVLYVDEFDRLAFDADLRRFMEALVAALPDQVQIAINSRLLTHQPWYDMVARGEAVVLGTEMRRDNGMFTLDPQARPQLEVYSLGRGYALVNGQPITNWDGALPRNLFFYFMDHALVTRDEIFATFWPDLSVKEATNVFHVTKRKISERIGMKVEEPGSYELTQYSGGFYIPSEKVIRHYDVGDFQAAIERAMIADDAEAEVLLAQAIDVYRGPFLQTVEMNWVVERRDNLRQLYTQALVSMARIAKRRGDFQGALGFFIRALKEWPEREDIHREVMNIYLKLDMREDARAQYRNLVDTLRTRLDIGPSRESQELYALIEAGG